MSRRASTLGGLALAAVILISACQTRTVTTTVSTATVSGPVEAVQRFARLQATQTPAIETTPPKMIGPGLAEIEIVMTDAVSADDVARVGQEAIAEGLSYSFTRAQTRATHLS